MKKNFRFLAMAVVAMAAAVFTGCSSDDDFLAPYEESAIQTRAISSTNALIDFDNVPSSVMAPVWKQSLFCHGQRQAGNDRLHHSNRANRYVHSVPD